MKKEEEVEKKEKRKKEKKEIQILQIKTGRSLIQNSHDFSLCDISFKKLQRDVVKKGRFVQSKVTFSIRLSDTHGDDVTVMSSIRKEGNCVATFSNNCSS